MIEILFGESEAGAMKSVLNNSRKLGSDVICLGMMLNIGSLKIPLSDKYRGNLLYKLIYQEQWGADKEMQDELKNLGAHYLDELNRLKEYLKNGESVRVWYSDSPYSLCGLFWLCNALYKTKRDICAVKLPDIEPYVSWGELDPEKFEKYLRFQRKLSADEVKHFSLEWQRLRSENAPLRAMLNGTVIGVPASFYDFLIWGHLGLAPKKEAVLIGEILRSNRIGVKDWWLASRIEHYIRTGKIKIIKDSKQKYARILQRNFFSDFE